MVPHTSSLFLLKSHIAKQVYLIPQLTSGRCGALRLVPACRCLLSSHGSQGYPEYLITFVPTWGNGSGGLCMKLFVSSERIKSSAYSVMSWSWLVKALESQLCNSFQFCIQFMLLVWYWPQWDYLNHGDGPTPPRQVVIIYYY